MLVSWRGGAVAAKNMTKQHVQQQQQREKQCQAGVSCNSFAVQCHRGSCLIISPIFSHSLAVAFKHARASTYSTSIHKINLLHLALPLQAYGCRRGDVYRVFWESAATAAARASVRHKLSQPTSNNLECCPGCTDRRLVYSSLTKYIGKATKTLLLSPPVNYDPCKNYSVPLDHRTNYWAGAT